MARVFDVFVLLTGLVLVSGGFIYKSPSLYIDLATIDTFAIASLITLLIFQKSIVQKSFCYRRFEGFLTKPLNTQSLIKLFTSCFLILLVGHTLKHWSLNTDGNDVSALHQSLFNPFGHPFFTADISASGSMFGEHIVFTLVPLAVITQCLRIDELLFLIQSLTFAIPMYFLIFKSPLFEQIKSMVWLPTFLFLANIAFRHTLMFDFREDSFIFVGLMVAAFGLLKSSVKIYTAGFLVAILSKEHVCLVTPFIAPVILLSNTFNFSKRTRYLLAGFTVVVSFLYAIIAFKLLIPFFNPELSHGISPIVLRLQQFGSTPSGIISNILLHPANWWLVLKNIFTKPAIVYIVKMLAPILPFLFFREALIFAIPAFAGMVLNILTGYQGQVSMQFHYDSIVFPFLFCGAYIGVVNSYQNGFLKPGSKDRPLRVLACLLLALSVSDKGPLFEVTHYFPNKTEIQTRLELLKLDREIAVATSLRLSAQVSQHKHIEIFNVDCSLVNFHSKEDFHGYVVVDLIDPRFASCEPVSGEPFFKNERIAIYQK